MIRYLVAFTLFAGPAMAAQPFNPSGTMGQQYSVIVDPNTAVPCSVATPWCIGSGGGGSGGPAELPSTNGSGTITTGGTFQTLLAQNSTRKGCFVQNPSTATEVLYIYVYSGTTGTPAVASSYSIPAGGNFTCAVGGYGVITDQIAIEAATTAHAFVEANQ